jgi:hypothetical protein
MESHRAKRAEGRKRYPDGLESNGAEGEADKDDTASILSQKRKK